LEPPRYRIHVLHDADAAFKSGDYETAIVLYQRVINDQALLDWVDPPVEQANLGAYARFKLIVLSTQSGQTDEAERYFIELKAGPETGNWHDYIDMADTYLQGVAIASHGCPAARDYAETHAGQILSSLGSTAFGYANPDYTPEDVCP
jgi:tetratricopeptide (TPR) repeat protein